MVLAFTTALLSATADTISGVSQPLFENLTAVAAGIAIVAFDLDGVGLILLADAAREEPVPVLIPIIGAVGLVLDIGSFAYQTNKLASGTC
jgi:hypothetical protein